MGQISSGLLKGCKDVLIEFVKRLALDVKPDGEFFTLKSGAKSRYYLDCRRVALHSYGLKAIVDCIYALFETDELVSMKVDAIGGPCVGADPIIGGMLHSLGARTKTFRGFLVRKEEKGHGKAGRIIGSVEPGDECVLFEDVTTSGSSSLEAIDAVEEFGCKVVAVVSVIDRLAGASEAFAARGIKFFSLLTIKDLGMVE